MKKFVATAFAAAMLAAVFVAPVGANSGRASNGSPGQYNNCTGLYQGDGSQFQQGEGSYYAAYYCFG